jgi:pilus assembly protein CpaF
VNIVILSKNKNDGLFTLNTLQQMIPNDERIIIIGEKEEIECLEITNDHVVKLEASSDGKIRDLRIAPASIPKEMLLKASLRMRPERVISTIIEEDFFDLMQAMNTGHDGSMGVFLVKDMKNLTQLFIKRLASRGFDLPESFMKELVCEAIDIFIELENINNIPTIKNIFEASYNANSKEITYHSIYETPYMTFSKYVHKTDLDEKFRRHNHRI